MVEEKHYYYRGEYQPSELLEFALHSIFIGLLFLAYLQDLAQMQL